MLKSRIKRRAIETARAVARLREIETSIAALNDDDLLDLADIFARETSSSMKDMAGVEMTKRNLSL